MLIDFSLLEEMGVTGPYGGQGTLMSRAFKDTNGKIILDCLTAGSSMGMREHVNSYAVCFIMSGKGKAVCDGNEEVLSVGSCHYCPRGSSHSIINDGDEDLIMLRIVPEFSESN